MLNMILKKPIKLHVMRLPGSENLIHPNITGTYSMGLMNLASLYWLEDLIVIGGTRNQIIKAKKQATLISF